MVASRHGTRRLDPALASKSIRPTVPHSFLNWGKGMLNFAIGTREGRFPDLRIVEEVDTAQFDNGWRKHSHDTTSFAKPSRPAVEKELKPRDARGKTAPGRS